MHKMVRGERGKGNHFFFQFSTSNTQHLFAGNLSRTELVEGLKRYSKKIDFRLLGVGRYGNLDFSVKFGYFRLTHEDTLDE